MGYQVPFPSELQQVEYVKLYFQLELVTSLKLPALALLQLRRELLQALRSFPELNADFFRQVQQLLSPALATDPVIQRLVQKPAPALVISPLQILEKELSANDVIVLPIIFIGSGMNTIDSFIKLLSHLGDCGLIHGRGKFFISSISGEDGSGHCLNVELTQSAQGKTVFPVNNLKWWLERQEQLPGVVEIELISPMRCIKKSKPLFKAEFVEVFPFILRRITSLIASHIGVEFRYDVARLLSVAATIKGVNNRLEWQDWRTLKSDDRHQSLGGLMGTITIRGDDLCELMWVLQLGTLFNCGKGAAYGAGQYRLLCV